MMGSALRFESRNFLFIFSPSCPKSMASVNLSTSQRVGCAARGRPSGKLGIRWLLRPSRGHPTLCAAQSGLGAAVATIPLERTADGFPAFIPKEFVDEIAEPACLDVLRSMQMAELEVEGLGIVKTAYVHAPYAGPASDTAPPAFVLLHGFDSSMLEFRRFISKLAPLGDVYAVDLAGWGFTDCGFAENANQSLGPQQKREHLKSFIQNVVQRQVTLLGTSLGGSVAIDFASVYQGVHVDRLVLVDAQGFIDGIGPMSMAPRFLSVLGVQVLKSVGLRQMANKMAYYDKKRYATDDAMRIGRLHTHLDGWVDANVAFMKSGGYSVSDKMQGLELPCCVVWGRNDEILDPSNADKFMEVLGDARLVWIDECGHVPALEQPDQLVAAIAPFMNE